jgi:hypothetical protein
MSTKDLFGLYAHTFLSKGIIMNILESEHLYAVKKVLISAFFLTQIIACTNNNSAANPNSSEDNAIYAYVAAGNEFKVIDIQNPTTPALLSTTATDSSFLVETFPFGAIVPSFSQFGNTYLDTISTFDPSNTVAQNFPSGVPFLRVTDMYYDNDHIFIGDEYRGLHVFDVNNFSLEVSILEYDTMSFTKLNDDMYIIHQDGGVNFSGLQKYDFTNISIPQLIASNANDIDATSYPTEERTHHSWIEHDDSFLYVANLTDKKLKKIDPTNLAVLAELNIQGHVTSLAIEDGYAYITVQPHASEPTLLTGDDAIKVIDLATMTLVDSIDLTEASGVAVLNDYVYVVDSNALHIYNTASGILTLVVSYADGAGMDIALGKKVQLDPFSFSFG